MNLNETIKTIWETLLKIEVQKDTDFFENGGNSLFAGIMIKKLQDQTGIIIRIPELYKHSVFSDFCALAENEYQK